MPESIARPLTSPPTPSNEQRIDARADGTVRQLSGYDPWRAVRWLRLLLIAAIVMPLLLFAATAAQDRRQVYASNEMQARKTAAILQEHALKVFDTLDMALNEVADRVRVADWDEIERSEAVHALLKRIAAGLPQIDTIWLTDATGRTRASSRYFPVPEVNVADRDYFMAQRDRDAGTYISRAYLGRLTKIAQFNLSRRLAQPDGTFDGVISISASPDYFAKFYNEIATDHTASIMLTRQDGAILARHPSMPAGTPLQIPTDGTLAAAIRAAPFSGLFVAQSPIDGVERIVAYRHLPKWPIYVSYAIAVDAVRAQWHANLLLYGIFALPATAALVLLAWVGMRQAERGGRAILAWRATATALQAETLSRTQAEEQLRQAQKMEAVGQLTGGIAHDFNNILQVIRGNVEVYRTARSVDVSRMMSAIGRAADRGATLTSQLLAFARKQHLDPRPAAINERLKAMSDFLAHAVGPNVTVAFHLAPSLWLVEVDVVQFETAVLNIAVNARDAMAGSGTLTLSTENCTLRGIGHDGLAGEFVAVSMRDTGSGMPAEIRERAFEPFFTTKEIGKGTGLGLSQVYGFARQSGGTVEIDSAPGEGTTVRLYLPRSLAGQTSGATAPRHA